MSYDRDPIYLHPKLHHALPAITAAIEAHLPSGHSCKMISSHRTPADQFELYKQGRTFKNGKWVKTGAVVTYKDGYINLSRHNYLPCLSLDIGIFDANGHYITADTLYKNVKFGASAAGFDWGGDWATFKDKPHIEIPAAKLFQSSPTKDTGLQWQRYLQLAGTYNGVLDGIFGPKSQAALQAATGQSVRSIDTWKQLFTAHGALP